MNDVGQIAHLSFARDSGFKNPYFMLCLNAPYRKGNPNLRIKTAGTADDAIMGVQQLKQPFFDGRFAVAAGNANHLQGKLLAVMSRQLLQGLNNIFNQQKIGIRKLRKFRYFGHYKTAYPGLVSSRQELMPVVMGTFDGKKEAAFGKNDLSTIEQEVFDLSLVQL